MWQLVTPAGSVADHDLTIQEMEQIEVEAGMPWGDVNPWRDAAAARACMQVVCAKLDVPTDGIRIRDFRPCKPDLPYMWDADGHPKGGRTIDRWLPVLVKKGFTPRQIREEFTLRDIMLLSVTP